MIIIKQSNLVRNMFCHDHECVVRGVYSVKTLEMLSPLRNNDRLQVVQPKMQTCNIQKIYVEQ